MPHDKWSETVTNTLWRGAFLVLLVVGALSLAKLQTASARLVVQIALLAALPLDAFLHSPKISPTLTSSALAPGVWTAFGSPTPPKLGEGRIMITPEAEQQLLFRCVPDMQLDFTAKRLAEWYNLNLLDGLPKVTGAFTLRPASFDRLERTLYYAPGTHCGQGLLDFLSVAWTSSPENCVLWSARTNYLPVITAGQRPVFASDEQSLAGMLSDEFVPRSIAYLPESARAQVTVAKQTDCALRNARFFPEQIEADVQAAEPSLVVLSQSYYHLWRAFVDGKPAPLLRANLAFQAVEVPSGNHHLKLVYRDRNLLLGSVISLVSLGVCGFILFPRTALARLSFRKTNAQHGEVTHGQIEPETLPIPAPVLGSQR